MSLLEVITKASANPSPLTSQSDYPIILNSKPILLNLKAQNEYPKDTSLVKRVEGWEISQVDTEIMELGKNFLKLLKRKLKNPNFNRDEFIGMLNSYMEKNREKLGMSLRLNPSDEKYTRELIEKLGFCMGPEVVGLVLEACIAFEVWELVETLIVHGVVEHSCSSNLVYNLIEKKKSDLVCLCLKHVSDLQASDILCILKYFLSPPKDAYKSMVSVRQEWEGQALMAIEKVTDKSLSGKKSCLAKEASILLMVAHDEFSLPELCLHFLLASSNLDVLILSSCVSKLNGSEMMGLIRYLGKWLKKYEKFPQASPCLKASSVLGLKACEFIPTLESIVKCLGLVLDEHFSSLVLHPEFHEELRAIAGLTNSLTSEARLCCSVANVIENLRTEL
ncbi:uncharacterized protein LOC132284171 [Cornus florida]|uniref:uncharacterized protein LOC132284171 n=1 Tax=Cornus florida TaxID=4283 RepID=UPI002897BC2E|nr:uncharacterized protein LOC132284171 [Cornus florida]